jgi:hypothetical protein
MATLLKVLNNLADIKSAGGVALRVRTQDLLGLGNTITVDNGNDTIDVGKSDTITVGTGHDSFIFEQTTAGNIGAVTINAFNPSLDAFTFSSLFAASLGYQDNAQGNAVITVDNAGDTVTLVGVHSSALQPSDFRFV